MTRLFCAIAIVFLATGSGFAAGQPTCSGIAQKCVHSCNQQFGTTQRSNGCINYCHTQQNSCMQTGEFKTGEGVKHALKQ